MSRDSKQQLIEQFIYEARASDAAHEAFDNEALRQLGVNPTDGRCLDIIDNEGPLTAGRLAELSGLTTAAVTSVLDRLERAGYARRVRDDTDRRRVLVELTPDFAKRARRIWEPLGRDAFAEFRKLSADDLRAAIDVLRLRRELNERHIERLRKLG